MANHLWAGGTAAISSVHTERLSNLLTVSCVVREGEIKSPGSQLFALIICLSKFIQCVLFHQSLLSKLGRLQK